MTDTRVPAGWYPDPLGLPQLRWWDNHAWTEHTSDSREPLVERETITPAARLEWADPTVDAAPAPVDPADAPAAGRPNGSPTSGAASPLAITGSLSAASLGTALAATAPGAGATLPSTPPVVAASSVGSPAAAPEGPAAVEAPGLDAPGLDAPAPAGPIVDLPEPAGLYDWSDVATALHHASLQDEQVILTVRAAGMPPITIDVAERIFWWDIDLTAFPKRVDDLRVGRAPRVFAELPQHAGSDLELLLWRVGNASFPGASAPWLDDRHRVKLRRWPNLTVIPHDADQLQMTSMLAHAHLTAGELAAVARTTVDAAQTLITAYDLMGLLQYVTDVPAGPSAPAVAFTLPESEPRGLFARLRARLGR